MSECRGTAAEDLTCQQRAAKWGYNLHGLTIIGQQKIGNMLPGLMSQHSDGWVRNPISPSWFLEHDTEISVFNWHLWDVFDAQLICSNSAMLSCWITWRVHGRMMTCSVRACEGVWAFGWTSVPNFSTTLVTLNILSSIRLSFQQRCVFSSFTIIKM